MFTNIHLTSFILITFAQMVLFLVFIYFKLFDEKLTGNKGDFGPSGPTGKRGNIGEQPQPFPCPTQSPDGKENECLILDWQYHELKGEQGDQGYTGNDGITNWDSEEADFHNLRCPSDNVRCSNEEMISNRIKNFPNTVAKNFWNI